MMRFLLESNSTSSSGSGSSETDTPTVLGLKIAAIFFIFVTTTLGTIPPLYFRSKADHNHKVFSYFNCLSGGIFLGFGFLHIFPDAVEGFDRDVTGFPLVYYLCFVGFFGVMMVERFFISLLQSQSEEAEIELPTTTNKGEDSKVDETGSTSGMEETKEMNHNSAEHQHSHSHGHGHGHGHEFHTHEIPISKNSRAMPYILTLGLSFHSIFEGLALSLQHSLLGLIVIFIGIGVHKPAESFAMGVNFLRGNVPKRKWLALVCTFASVTPCGIILGLILTQVLNGSTLDLTASILQSFAVGAFLYVAILGVIVEEFSNTQNLIPKAALFMFGFTCMGMLGVLETAEPGGG